MSTSRLVFHVRWLLMALTIISVKRNTSQLSTAHLLHVVVPVKKCELMITCRIGAALDQEMSAFRSNLPSIDEGCSSSDDNSRVRVVVRIRPLSQKEIVGGHKNILEGGHHHITAWDPTALETTQKPDMAILDAACWSKKFAFDRCLWSTELESPAYASQSDVFEEVGKPVLEWILGGFNCCVFAFGQTGAGKTWTMMGDIKREPTDYGLIPRICFSLFESLEGKASDGLESVTYSHMEIYNENVRDLLAPNASNKGANEYLRVREHPTRGIFVSNLTTMRVTNFDDLMSLIVMGDKNRTVGATNANTHSSRSHAVVTLTVVQRSRSAVKNGLPTSALQQRMGRVHLVDLAGSERVALSGAQGTRLREANNINRSLSVLGDVIKCLGDSKSRKGGKKGHVPYRNSTLTMVLKDSLGGNAHAVMVTAVSPSSFDYEETISTLKYADRAKRVRMRVEANVTSGLLATDSSAVELVPLLQAEVRKLREMLTLQRMPVERERDFLESRVVEEMRKRVSELETQLAEREKLIDSLDLMRREELLEEEEELERMFLINGEGRDFRADNRYNLYKNDVKYNNYNNDYDMNYNTYTNSDHKNHHIINNNSNSNINDYNKNNNNSNNNSHNYNHIHKNNNSNSNISIVYDSSSSRNDNRYQNIQNSNNIPHIQNSINSAIHDKNSWDSGRSIRDNSKTSGPGSPSKSKSNQSYPTNSRNNNHNYNNDYNNNHNNSHNRSLIEGQSCSVRSILTARDRGHGHEIDKLTRNMSSYNDAFSDPPPPPPPLSTLTPTPTPISAAISTSVAVARSQPVVLLLEDAVDVSHPRVINLNQDPLFSECLVYYIPEGTVYAGSKEADSDILLSGPDIINRHCEIRHDSKGCVTLHAVDSALVYVNGDVIPIDHDVTGQGVILHHFDRIAFGRYHLFRFEAGGIHGQKNGKNSDNSKNCNSLVTVMINENNSGKDSSIENGSNPSALVPPGWEYAQEELMIKNDPQTRGPNPIEGRRYDRNDVDTDVTMKTHFSNHFSNDLREKNILTTGIEGVKRFISVREDSVSSKTVLVSSPDRNNRSWTGTKSPPKISDSPGINLDRNKHSTSIIDRGNDFRNRNNILQFETSSKIKNKNRELINMSNLPNRTKSNIKSFDKDLNITFDDENNRDSSYSIANSVNLNISNQVSQVSHQSSTSSTTRIMLVRPKVTQSFSKDDDNNIENGNDNNNDSDNDNDVKGGDKDRKNLNEFYPDMDMDPPRNGNGNGEVTERKRAVRNMVENHIGDYMSTVQRDSRRDWEIIERTNGGRTRTDSDTALGRNGIIVENGNESRIVHSRILISSTKTLNVNERQSSELIQSRNARTTLQRDSNSTNIEDGKRKKGGDNDIHNEAKKDATGMSSHTNNTIDSENNRDEITDDIVSSYNGNNDNNSNNGSNININSIDNNHIPDKDDSSFVSGHDDSSTKLKFPKENNKNMKNNSDISITKIDNIKNNNNNNNIKNSDNGMEIQVPTFEKEALALQLELAQMQRALQDRMHRYQVLTSFNPEKLNQ